ncbi:MAG: hypothetical protein GOV00_02795 [Candidatus Altiarchaeota archaeon]|nr:hypothetical protein [Candidatus Altiarchaeota archaeon]
MLHQVLKSATREKSVNYYDLPDYVKDQVPELREGALAVSVFSFEEDADGISAYRTIMVKEGLGFEREAYPTYENMIEELMSDNQQEWGYRFRLMAEIAAHEGFHQMDMDEKLNNYVSGNLDKIESSGSYDEGYALIFGKTMAHLLNNMKENGGNNHFELYQNALERAGEEIVLAKRTKEEQGLTNDKAYKEYLVPAYELLSEGKEVELLPYASEFLSSIQSYLPEKYQSCCTT